ncbi:MAG TPA: hypothetical protein VF188_12120 [Longimicrobiales bacterium]
MRRFWLLFLIAYAAPLAAQQDTTRLPTGVRLGLIYQTLQRPLLAVRPFTADFALAGVAEQTYAIVRRDLDYSDRFEMYETPPQLAEGPVDYAQWNGLGVVYVVTGSVQPLGPDGVLLRLALHDVVYGHIKEIRAFELPAGGTPEFRMAVHAAADEVVRWATGQRGMAASRIAFVLSTADGGSELMVVDSDGENVQRIAASSQTIMTPVWSPDGRRIAYTMLKPDGGWEVVERDLSSGDVRVIAADAPLNLTPAYSPDGSRLALAVWSRTGTDIYAYDVAGACCLEPLRTGPGEDMSPTYSPDGRQIAFMSDRIGQPHIYIMPAEGGEATLLTPYVYGEAGYYTAPDWSPQSSLVAFTGRSRGRLQVMVADSRDPGGTVRQLTDSGSSEDPSWAPDGRHIVFKGVRAEGRGLYVMDAVSGRTRPLLLRGGVRLPDWSPSLQEASAPAVRGE